MGCGCVAGVAVKMQIFCLHAVVAVKLVLSISKPSWLMDTLPTSAQKKRKVESDTERCRQAVVAVKLVLPISKPSWLMDTLPN